MRGRTLQKNRTLWKEFSCFCMPFLDRDDVFLCTVFDATIFVEPFSKQTRDGDRELVQPWNDSRSRHDDLTMFKHEATPALTDKHEVGLLGPDPLGHLNEERIRIRLHDIGIPIAMILVPDDNHTRHEVLWRVGWVTVVVHTEKLLYIRFHDLRPSLTVIQVDAIYLHFGDVSKDLVNKEIPSLNFPVVEHSRVLVMLALAICSVANVSAALLGEVVKQEVFVFSVVSGRADSCQGVDNDFDIACLRLVDDGLETFVTTKHFVRLVS